MSDFYLRRVQIIHKLSLIGIIVSSICTVIALKLSINDLVYLHGLNILLYFICAMIAKKGNLRTSRLFLFIILNTGILASASYIGQEGGVEFMLMFSLSLPFLVFSFQSEKPKMFIFSIIPISLWAALYLTDFNLITDSKINIEIAQDSVYPVSMITTLFLVTFQLSYYSYLNFTSLSSIHTSREQALEASSAKSKFLSTMSHEIRTPLNAVIGLSHILGDNTPRKDQEENIDALNYSGKILLNLLNNVLDFSKMQSTIIELDNIPTDISVAIKQIKKIHESSCFRKGISMNLEIDKDIPIVWLDIVRFNQVLNNLITNAIKFTEEGSVTLRIKKKEKTRNTINLLVEIIDTGIGIPKKQTRDNLGSFYTGFNDNKSFVRRYWVRFTYCKRNC